jgi:hypothetical protein
MITCDRCGTHDAWPGPVIIEVTVAAGGWHMGRESRNCFVKKHLCKPCALAMWESVKQTISGAGIGELKAAAEDVLVSFENGAMLGGPIQRLTKALRTM